MKPFSIVQAEQRSPEWFLGHYAPGTWADCTCYGPDGHIAYAWEAKSSDG